MMKNREAKRNMVSAHGCMSELRYSYYRVYSRFKTA